MSKARLVITAVTIEKRPIAEVARDYGVARSWIYELLTRYRNEGETAFQPRSKRPHTSPNATPPETTALVLHLREQLTTAGHDAGADTLAWHLQQQHQITLSRATIHRILTRAGHIIPEPKKRPKASYIRFEATMPNETWQSDFTHYRLTDGTAVEIITWLDDCTRYALHLSAHPAITTPIVTATFRSAAAQHGIPASTLTDNGMVYTVRLAGRGRQGGRNGFEQQLRTWNVTQKNGRPNRPTTQGKVERFQQTMKKWLRAQPEQPGTLQELQALLEQFRSDYNQHRPHRSLPHRATPATLYNHLPKAVPDEHRLTNTHDRIRHDRVDKSGTVTLRSASRLHHIGVGRTHAGTHVILLIQDLDVRIANAITGELLRELTINPDRDYQGRNQNKNS